MKKRKATTSQWYEILRKDGTKHYALKFSHTDGYFLGGSGRAYTSFDCVSMLPIDAPPVLQEQGTATIDGGGAYKAVCNVNHTWNGWAVPYIHSSSINQLIKDFTEGQDTTAALVIDEYLEITMDEETQRFDAHVIEGETYYLLDGGFCFDFEPKNK